MMAFSLFMCFSLCFFLFFSATEFDMAGVVRCHAWATFWPLKSCKKFLKKKKTAKNPQKFFWFKFTSSGLCVSRNMVSCTIHKYLQISPTSFSYLPEAYELWFNLWPRHSIHFLEISTTGCPMFFGKSIWVLQLDKWW